MDELKKLKQFSIFWKKIFIFGVLFVLAVPLLIVVGRNFQSRVENFSSQEFLNEVKPVSTEQSIGLESILEELEGLMNMAATTTATSTE